MAQTEKPGNIFALFYRPMFPPDFQTKNCLSQTLVCSLICNLSRLMYILRIIYSKLFQEHYITILSKFSLETRLFLWTRLILALFAYFPYFVPRAMQGVSFTRSKSSGDIFPPKLERCFPRSSLDLISKIRGQGQS